MASESTPRVRVSHIFEHCHENLNRFHQPTLTSLSYKKHWAIKLPLSSLDHCNATSRIFFLVSPYIFSVLHTVLGEISIPNTCITSKHNSPRYIDGFSKITPTCNSLRRSSLLQSNLFRRDRGSTVPLSSNNRYIRCTILTATFKYFPRVAGLFSATHCASAGRWNRLPFFLVQLT